METIEMIVHKTWARCTACAGMPNCDGCRTLGLLPWGFLCCSAQRQMQSYKLACRRGATESPFSEACHSRTLHVYIVFEPAAGSDLVLCGIMTTVVYRIWKERPVVRFHSKDEMYFLFRQIWKAQRWFSFLVHLACKLYEFSNWQEILLGVVSIWQTLLRNSRGSKFP